MACLPGGPRRQPLGTPRAPPSPEARCCPPPPPLGGPPGIAGGAGAAAVGFVCAGPRLGLSDPLAPRSVLPPGDLIPRTNADQRPCRSPAGALAACLILRRATLRNRQRLDRALARARPAGPGTARAPAPPRKLLPSSPPPRRAPPQRQGAPPGFRGHCQASHALAPPNRSHAHASLLRHLPTPLMTRVRGRTAPAPRTCLGPPCGRATGPPEGAPPCLHTVCARTRRFKTAVATPARGAARRRRPQRGRSSAGPRAWRGARAPFGGTHWNPDRLQDPLR
jgi:hypothetical protein